MATIETLYIGELRTEAKHIASGKIIITDAPLDNMGKGEGFSPTDLLAASLGSCMLTIMGIAANSIGVNIDGTQILITKIMASNPRRVSKLGIEIKMPSRSYSENQKRTLEAAAINCPVAKSLNTEIIQQVNFQYQNYNEKL